MKIRTLAIGLALLLTPWPIRAADPDVLRIGFVDSLLKEASPTQRKLLGSEFRDLVRDFTGLKSVILEGLSPDTAARQLDSEKWHLGVFHGVEFAWIQAKHPQLRPLMITTTRESPVRAVLVVKKESAVGSIADLKGKNVSLLQNLHCRLFMEKSAGISGNYFDKLLPTRNVEEALDGMLRGDVQGAIVDTLSLTFYKEIQPGRFDHLKVAAESAAFPPGVIVYHQGTLSDALLRQLKEKMLKVKDSDKGRESLNAFRITGFEAVPADFQQSLTAIVEAFPDKESGK